MYPFMTLAGNRATYTASSFDVVICGIAVARFVRAALPVPEPSDAVLKVKSIVPVMVPTLMITSTEPSEDAGTATHADVAADVLAAD
jgi:hypothetical protein